MDDSRPLFKRAKFVALVIASVILAGSFVTNALVPGAVETGVQGILAAAIAGFFAAQGYVDGQKAKSGPVSNGS